MRSIDRDASDNVCGSADEERIVDTLDELTTWRVRVTTRH